MNRVKTCAEWLAERQVGLDQLVEKTGLDRKVVEAIVQGRYTPSPQQRGRLAAALNLEPNDIAWGHAASVEHIHGHGPQFGRSP